MENRYRLSIFDDIKLDDNDEKAIRNIVHHLVTDFEKRLRSAIDKSARNPHEAIRIDVEIIYPNNNETSMEDRRLRVRAIAAESKAKTTINGIYKNVAFLEKDEDGDILRQSIYGHKLRYVILPDKINQCKDILKIREYLTKDNTLSKKNKKG